MGNQGLVLTNVYYVKEVYQLVVNDDTSLKSFTSFFAADDFCCECESNGLNVYIESRTAVGPVITDQDLDNYAELNVGVGIDPRNDFAAEDLPEVMVFMSLVAELKAVGFNEKSMNAEAFMYETLAYEYDKIANGI